MQLAQSITADMSAEPPQRVRVPLDAKKRLPNDSRFLCGQRDSNPHASRHQILSLTWLPITPCPQDLSPSETTEVPDV